ncbi:TPA: hypothetical protein RZK39_000291 [Campylobacter coli]|nr:hypothetical protein [Campylobacter coli]HEB9347116.1 hypothetical protein [Campylobacter coli]HEB9356216.1 hypothetical protein [Campylobacter coli]
MKTNTIEKNEYLSKNIELFYDLDYTRFGDDKNPDFLNILKNTFSQENELVLKASKDNAKRYIYCFLEGVIKKYRGQNFVICSVPRSKANFLPNQLLFQKAISEAIDELNKKYFNVLIDGVNFIKRKKNVKTTHIKSSNYQNDGDYPYPGITKKTCFIDYKKINNANVVLIDDIYTKTINVIEDCIQALLDFNADVKCVYCIAQTKKKELI